MSRACTHCGFELPGSAGECPLCGTPTPEAAPASGVRAGEPGTERRRPGEGADGERVAWEDPEVGFPGNLARSWWRSMTDPRAFFARVDWGEPLARPLLYYLLVVVAASALTLVAGGGGDAAAVEDLAGRTGVSAEALLWLGFFLSPFYALAGLLLWTLVLHLFVAMLAPDRRGLGDTARIACYASSPALLSVVPWIGGILAWGWAVVLHVAGVRHGHRTGPGRAAAAVLLPFGLAIVLLFLFVFFAVSLLDRLPGPALA